MSRTSLAATGHDLKDLVVPRFSNDDDPPYDDLPLQRERVLAGLAILLAMAAVLAVVALAVTVVVAYRPLPIPTSEVSGRLLRVTGDNQYADSVQFDGAAIVEDARRFLEGRFGYDWRTGRTPVVAAIYMGAPRVRLSLAPAREDLDRLEAAQTVIRLQIDSLRLAYTTRGQAEVTAFGIKRVNNIEVPDPSRSRNVPFREVVTFDLHLRQEGFPYGRAVLAFRGDLVL